MSPPIDLRSPLRWAAAALPLIAALLIFGQRTTVDYVLVGMYVIYLVSLAYNPVWARCTHGPGPRGMAHVYTVVCLTAFFVQPLLSTALGTELVPSLVALGVTLVLLVVALEAMRRRVSV